MIILCLNCGSSSVKYRVYDWGAQATMATGIVEKIGMDDSFCVHQIPSRTKAIIPHSCGDHREAIQFLTATLLDQTNGVLESLSGIVAVGHRVVHGGEKFARSVVVTEEVLEAFRGLAELAPLHNPSNILGIEVARSLIPDVPHMAIIDTAWHQTMPRHSFIYALPYEWYENHGIRRYGFHGTSLLYVSRRTAVLLGKDPFECNLVVCHIGNGVSLNAVRNGVSYDTSMGFTPLEGLVMGTRAGDHDPAIDLFMMEREGYTPREMSLILNTKSGILGVTGKYIDRRDVEKAAEDGDERAKLAIEMESYRIRKYIGAYSAALGGVDAVVFTGGVGERSSIIRAKALDGLEFMGIRYDKGKNGAAKTRNGECDISTPNSQVKVFVIPTDEERVFIEDVVALLSEAKDGYAKFTYTFQSPEYRNSLRDEAFEKECAQDPALRRAAARVPRTDRSKKST